jgi:hypothetical protein
MDHDAVDKRLWKVERFLDAVQPGWREESNWPKARAEREEPSLNEEAAESDLVVDEEKTKADRIELGYDTDPNDPNAPGNEPKEQMAAEWTDPEGGVWVRSPAEGESPEKWVTEDGTDNRQEFIGSLDELRVLTKPAAPQE